MVLTLALMRVKPFFHPRLLPPGTHPPVEQAACGLPPLMSLLRRGYSVHWKSGRCIQDVFQSTPGGERGRNQCGCGCLRIPSTQRGIRTRYQTLSYNSVPTHLPHVHETATSLAEFRARGAIAYASLSIPQKRARHLQASQKTAFQPVQTRVCEK